MIKKEDVNPSNMLEYVIQELAPWQKYDPGEIERLKREHKVYRHNNTGDGSYIDYVKINGRRFIVGMGLEISIGEKG